MSENLVRESGYIANSKHTEHWEHNETPGDGLGTVWEQTGNKTGNIRRPPFGNATPGGSPTALGTVASLVRAGTALPESCRFESTGLAA
jgi:hypothetical protein